MELSPIVQQHLPALSRSERSLVSALPDTPSSVVTERYEQQMKALADARSTLKQVPDKKTADRQDKAEKIQMLKERLKMLKQMIPFMSPSAVKSLKAELRQIAAQLSSLAADGRNGGSGDVSAVDLGSTGAAEAADKVATAKDTSTDEDESAAKGETGGQSTGITNNSKPTRAGSENSQMQEEMEELKRLYRSVRVMVQRKLQQTGDKGEPLPSGPPPLQVYVPLPETSLNVTVRV
ncbi:MAG: hypothetical protein RBQ99_06205 [Trichlorobacter sp.]|nr:hypothetical protein [Trichlorobacter sp.]